MSTLAFNPQVKLIISDVDETVADLYMSATPPMVFELITLLEENRVLFFVTGQSVKGVLWRVVDLIPLYLHRNILIGHCSGTEVFGFEENGAIKTQPYYSVYESQMNSYQKERFRQIIQQLIDEFHLTIYPPMPVLEFRKQVGEHPLAVMYEDRGPQITFEFANGYDMNPDAVSGLQVVVPATHGAYDLRIPFLERGDELLKAAKLPISPRLGGEFAVDFAVEGVSKTTAVRHVLENFEVLQAVGLTQHDLENPEHIEIWGDKFSSIRGGTDRHMCEAVSPEVRSIDFRQEDPAEFLSGYNTVVWNGQKHLHEGLLEYLQSRHAKKRQIKF